MEKDTEIDFDFMLKVDRPHDTFSYLQGFLSAVNQFAIWRDGERLIGACELKAKDIKKQIENYTKQEM